MKGIVLAGGSGSRLYPITKGVSKQLLPIYDKPMIYYPISVLMLAGIREILIITTPQDSESFKRLLGDGGQFGVGFSYAIQESPRGLADAFIVGEEFIGDDSVCLVLGDNIFHGPGFSKMLKIAVSNAEDFDVATVFGYHVNDPERYGVVEYEGHTYEDDPIIVKSIEEKPQIPKSDCAVVGLYFYPNDVVKIAKEITPSKRGELEITDVNNKYINYTIPIYSYEKLHGYKCCELLDKEQYGEPSETKYRTENHLSLQIFNRGFAWLDTGTFDSLSEASDYIETIEKRQGLKVACLEEIAFKNGWITLDRLHASAKEMEKNEYGKYLMKLYNEKSINK